MGMTLINETTNATAAGFVAEDAPAFGIDTWSYEYDFSDGALSFFALLEHTESEFDGEAGFIFLSETGAPGAFVGDGEFLGGSAWITGFREPPSDTFTYQLTFQEWLDAGSPATVELLIEINFSASDTEDRIIFNLTCFARDTLIATPDGEVPVQDLKIGDLVMTPDGDVPVKWIGHRSDYTVFSGPDMQPVRIRAGALGPGVPRRDLQVTADHGMLVDGLIVTAGALINGDTIDVVPLDEMAGYMTYYHIETEAHAVIWAEGAPAETYIDYVGRQAFDNYAEYVALYGEDRAIREMAYPRITSARMVPTTLGATLAWMGDSSLDVQTASG